MYFGMCIYDCLSVDGRLDSIIICPSEKSPFLVVDRLSDVGPNLSRDVDIGPLRFYTKECGLSVRTAAAQLRTPIFQAANDCIEFQIEHLHWPLPQSHAGYYMLLLPSRFCGSIHSSESSFRMDYMTDEHQMLISLTVFPFRPSLTISGSLKYNAPVPEKARKTTSRELYRNTLPGIHYTPVDNILKAMRHDLSSSASAFLCHSSADKKAARRLAIELATRGVRPWIDEAEIKIGDSLIEKIQAGIESVTCLVPVLSSSSVSSRWCQEELKMALARQIKSGTKSVLPVLIEDCDIPGFLIEKAYADFRDNNNYDNTVDRLAATIREMV